MHELNFLKWPDLRHRNTLLLRVLGILPRERATRSQRKLADFILDMSVGNELIFDVRTEEPPVIKLIDPTQSLRKKNLIVISQPV